MYHCGPLVDWKTREAVALSFRGTLAALSRLHRFGLAASEKASRLRVEPTDWLRLEWQPLDSYAASLSLFGTARTCALASGGRARRLALRILVATIAAALRFLP